MNKAIFFDRDGVLNEAIVKNGKPYPPATLEELTITEDAFEVLSKLKSQGYLLIGATNQPDVARGITAQSHVEAVNKILMERLPLTEILTCYHDDSDRCACRKPKPGMLLTAAQKHQVDLNKSFMIGDRDKDIIAGHNAGCKSILLERNYHQGEMAVKPHHIAQTLTQAVFYITEES